jgi:hypothetical protein
MLFPLFFACLLIIGELAAESGFCWKKDRQDTIFLKINNSKKYTEIHILPEYKSS